MSTRMLPSAGEEEESCRSKDRHEVLTDAHATYAEYHRHRNDSGSDGDDSCQFSFPQFHKVSKTGVIYATTRAASYGYTASDKNWANMGQGAPETGTLPNAPDRNFDMSIPFDEVEYAPVAGDSDLREAVAKYYNHLYRNNIPSKYTGENICIVPGGRAGLTRIMAILGHVQVGYFTPDYTAYEQALNLFTRINPTQYVHRDVNEALMPPEEFEFQTVGRGVGAVLFSNPCNPTGQSLEGGDLKRYVQIARDNGTVLLMDEFYSHFYYDGEGVDPVDGGLDDDSNWPKSVSSSSFIEDVNKDPVVIVNGLTKNWRCPGFRVCWVVAPERIIRMLTSAGSFLDGGANAPLQKLALPLMDIDFIRKDTWALQRHFRAKRNFLLRELSRLGIKVALKPSATFYIWADLSLLQPPLNDCLVFFEECIRAKVICVPGVFFDVNPGHLRNVKRSKCISHVRFSYGPPMHTLTQGVEQIEKVIERWTGGDSKHRKFSSCRF